MYMDTPQAPLSDTLKSDMSLLDEGVGISGGPVPVPRTQKKVANVNLPPVGSGTPEIAQHRNRLGKAFISRMRADFQKHGIAVIERVRKERPAAYLELVARLMPQSMEINVNHSFIDLLQEAQRRYLEDTPVRVIDAEYETYSDSSKNSSPGDAGSGE
jgi:hypothetical protein